MITLATPAHGDTPPAPATQAEIQHVAIVLALIVAALYLGWLVIDWVLDGSDAQETTRG